jgi:hypothetical protein
MGFYINCDNKGCREYMEPKLDIQTNIAYCDECGKEVKSITQFAKTQMRQLGQILKNKVTQTAFSIQCNNCKTMCVPIINKDNTVQCSQCNGFITNLSKAYINLIKSEKD